MFYCSIGTSRTKRETWQSWCPWKTSKYPYKSLTFLTVYCLCQIWLSFTWTPFKGRSGTDGLLGVIGTEGDPVSSLALFTIHIYRGDCLPMQN